MKYINVVGQRFGKWVVLSRDENKSTNVICKCDCGSIKSVWKSTLRNGESTGCTSCGLRKHGDSGTRLYSIYTNMKNRCGKVKEYLDVSVCEEWKDFDMFKSWALSNGYTDNLTIDRIDAHGNYTPGNCRWADKNTQSANTRKPIGRFIGVYKKRDKWAVRIVRKLKSLNLGVFESPQLGALVRDMYIIEHKFPHTLNHTWYKPTNKVGWVHG